LLISSTFSPSSFSLASSSSFNLLAVFLACLEINTAIPIIRIDPTAPKISETLLSFVEAVPPA